MVHVPFVNFAYIANSKTDVEFREIFHSGKGFHKQKKFEKLWSACVLRLLYLIQCRCITRK
jgi:hypothetical protein